jgi:hypothetical protein
VRRRERCNNEVRQDWGDFGVIPGPGVFLLCDNPIRVQPVSKRHPHALLLTAGEKRGALAAGRVSFRIPHK